MKKKVVMGATLLISLALAGVVSANPASWPDLDQIRPDKVRVINADLEKVVAQPVNIKVTDYKPTGYAKRELNRRTVESRIKDGAVFRVIDHNPRSYTKRELGGHMVESWIKGGVAYTAVDGVTTKSSVINADLEKVVAQPVNIKVTDYKPTGYAKRELNRRTVESRIKDGAVFRVIDHNPMSYTKRELGGHTVESWIKDGVAYTVLDRSAVKE